MPVRSAIYYRGSLPSMKFVNSTIATGFSVKLRYLGNESNNDIGPCNNLKSMDGS